LSVEIFNALENIDSVDNRKDLILWYTYLYVTDD